MSLHPSLRSDTRQSPSLRSDSAQVNRNTRPDHAGTTAQIDRNTQTRMQATVESCEALREPPLVASLRRRPCRIITRLLHARVHRIMGTFRSRPDLVGPTSPRVEERRNTTRLLCQSMSPHSSASKPRFQR